MDAWEEKLPKLAEAARHDKTWTLACERMADWFKQYGDLLADAQQEFDSILEGWA